MALYATQTDFEAYVEGWQTDDPVGLERLLERAQWDLDNRVLITYGLYTTGLPAGHRLDPSILISTQRAALARATCAQAEYRLAKGEPFFVEISAPSGEFATTSVKEPYIAPKAMAELRGGGLLRSTVRVV